MHQISADGESAHHPFWSRNGKEFFYWGITGSTLISSSLTLNGSVTAGRPVPIPGHPSNMNALGPLNYDITPDGREFVRTQALAAASTGGPGSVRVVLGWLEELKRLAPARP